MFRLSPDAAFSLSFYSLLGLAHNASRRFEIDFESVDWAAAFQRLRDDCESVESVWGLDLLGRKADDPRKLERMPVQQLRAAAEEDETEVWLA